METKFNTNKLLRICVKNQINDLNIFNKYFFRKISVAEEFECIYCTKLGTIDNSLRINTVSNTH
jgi:hypothetical protein